MTTAKASSAPPGRRYGVVLQRALLRSARPPRFRFSGYSALAALSLSLSKARRASAVTLALSLSLFGAACAGPLAPVTHAADVVVREAPPSPRAACRVAARQAEITHGVPEGLLTAIALSESGLHAYALNLRGRAYFPNSREEASRMLEAAGGRGMAGCFQINAGVHVARGEDWPLDPPQAADWAARYLVRHYKDQGDWGSAILRWHGASASRGTQIICRVHSKLEVTAPGSTLFADRCRPGSPQWARVRQNGAARLEVAEAAE